MSAVQFYLKNQDLKALQEKLKYKHISQTTLENLTVYCGYSPYGQDSVYVDGQKANIQIAVEKDLIIVGFPLILTGYWWNFVLKQQKFEMVLAKFVQSTEKS